MSGQISDSKVEQVRDRTDIVSLISQYVSLKQAGRNHVGLCPFHGEKTPSFSVNAERQFFHCFGCGEGGDVFSFIMKTEGISFPDAVRKLAERCGVDLEERPLTSAEQEQLALRERLYRINDLAAELFHDNLMRHPQAEGARQYLKKRGYGQKAATEFRLGYALDQWTDLRDHLQLKEVDAGEARSLGLIRAGKQGRGDFDMFRGRLMFPVCNLAGRVVAFGGRVLDDGKPKYINSPESPIYHKGDVLFGLYQARQAIRASGDALVVEGYFDQLALQRAGFAQAVATCGTALTGDQARHLKRYARRVVLVFDQDNAGRQATYKAMTALQQEEVTAAVISLPTGEDPDSFLRRQGADAFRKLLDSARPAMELFIEETLRQAGSGVEYRVRAVEAVLERLAQVKSDLEKDLYLKELARRSGIDTGLLQQKLRKITAARPGQATDRTGFAATTGRGPSPAQRTQSPVSDRAPTLGRAEGTLIRLLLQSAAGRRQFVQAGGMELLPRAEVRDIVQLILDQDATGACDIATLLPLMTPDQAAIIQSLAGFDPEEFADSLEQATEDCLRSLQKQALKKRSDKLWRELIPEAENRGDSALADNYRTELRQLQMQIKGGLC